MMIKSLHQEDFPEHSTRREKFGVCLLGRISEQEPSIIASCIYIVNMYPIKLDGRFQQ